MFPEKWCLGDSFRFGFWHRERTVINKPRPPDPLINHWIQSRCLKAAQSNFSCSNLKSTAVKPSKGEGRCVNLTWVEVRNGKNHSICFLKSMYVYVKITNLDFELPITTLLLPRLGCRKGIRTVNDGNKLTTTYQLVQYFWTIQQHILLGRKPLYLELTHEKVGLSAPIALPILVRISTAVPIFIRSTLRLPSV